MYAPASEKMIRNQKEYSRFTLKRFVEDQFEKTLVEKLRVGQTRYVVQAPAVMSKVSFDAKDH